MPDWSGSLEIDGQGRTYACHRPAELSSAAPPLLIALHGRRLTLSEWRAMTHFDALANRHGFVVVYPEGHQLTWNDGRDDTPAARAGVDDVGFIRNLIDLLVAELGADPGRVAVTGLSNGATMCHRLALELSDRITTIAAVAGKMPVGLAEMMPTHAVSVLLIHGTRDPYSPIQGGRSPRGRLMSLLLREKGLGSGESLSLRATAARWRAIDGCGDEITGDPLPPEGGDPTSVERWEATGGRGGTDVNCWVIHGGGHTWPGGPWLPFLGRTTRLFDAGEVIWEFAARHFSPAEQRRLS